MRGPSQHLSWSELACKDGTPYPLQWRSTRAVTLASAFERVRLEMGDSPLVVLSAYRTPEHNRRIGGAKRSQHIEGRALDLRPPRGMVTLAFFRQVREIVADTDIRGLGLYPTFLHIDIRPSERLILWSATRVWAEMP